VAGPVDDLGFYAGEVVNWTGHTYNGWGNSPTATATSTFPSGAVLNTTVTASAPIAEYLRISFTAVSGADRYAVYWGPTNTGPWTHLNTYVGAMSNLDFSVGPGTRYAAVVAYSESTLTVGSKVLAGPVTVP